jgi:hypothetical protein
MTYRESLSAHWNACYVRGMMRVAREYLDEARNARIDCDYAALHHALNTCAKLRRECVRRKHRNNAMSA